jgi:hypothetical protein
MKEISYYVGDTLVHMTYSQQVVHFKPPHTFRSFCHRGAKACILAEKKSALNF